MVTSFQRSARFADIPENRLQLIEHDAKILCGEQHALAVDHIFDTSPVTNQTRAERPEPEPWPARASAHRSGFCGRRKGKERLKRVQNMYVNRWGN
jgi:hypothetical protein